MKTCFFIVMALVVFALFSVVKKPAEFKKIIGLLGLLVQRLVDLFVWIINNNVRMLSEGDI
ncbi:hypothetical protein ES703_79757 [subsurface metagenome]